MATELPRFVVAAIQNAAAGTVDDKIAWLNDQRKIMSDEEARARAEAVLGDIPDDDWAQLQSYATAQAALDAEAQARAQPIPVYGAPAGWRYSLVTGELVPIDASVDELVALQTDQGLTAEQEEAKIRRDIIIQVSQLNLDEKIDFINRELELQSESNLRNEIESVLGKQDDTAWAMLTQYAAEQRAPEVLTPPAAPSDSRAIITAPIITAPVVTAPVVTAPVVTAPVAITKKPVDITTAPVSVSVKEPAMIRSVGNVPLPSNWDTFTAQQKIAWFNVNKITPEALKAAGVADTDVAWMRQNGYVVGLDLSTPAAQPQGAGLPLILAAAAYFLMGS